jgi:hypothetical protein
MSNAYGNPFAIDTADTRVVSPDQNVYIKRVVWKSPATAGDTLVIKDGSGNKIVDAVCEVALQSQVFLVEHSYNGINVTTIDSGTAYIHWN